MTTLTSAIALWLLTMAAGAACLVLGEFGAPIWLMLLLLAWLATLGLPASLGVLFVTWWWPGGLLPMYLTTAAAAALLAQLGVFYLLSGLLLRLRVRNKRADHTS